MRTYDFSPLFRSSVGFDRMARVLDSLSADAAPAYPPYNIEKTGDDQYRITMAVAGFGEGELEIRTQENMLVITGRIEKGEDTEQRSFLHRGIAERAFERQFSLADHVKVVAASLENGLLHVDLAREVPEAMKPRTIAIRAAGGKSQRIESNAA
ncbi:MAG: Hsp20 family protein [Alphaproteobacteria bacterium]|nr:Hsp20 family protein [Alphaproteobacteria bacterium]